MSDKEIKGYEGLYKISDCGKVFSVVKNKFLSPSKSSGYHTVSLYKNTNLEYHSVHRLVALHFIPNPNNYRVVLHKDDDGYNNLVDNLVWGSHKTNTQDMVSKGRCNPPHGSRSKSAKLNEAKVLDIRHLLSTTKIQQKDIAKMYDVSPQTIYLIKNRKTWKHI